MSKTFDPNANYMLISWNELETALRVLSAPEKLDQIEDSIQAVKVLYRTAGPEKAIIHLVALTAWLTDGGVHSHDG